VGIFRLICFSASCLNPLIDAEEATDLQPDIDDTDGLDPAAEFEEWRARELARLLREKQAQAERDEERDEIERRRAMPEEQRMREDMEYAEATRAREKGDMAFLQKYYHKGAFHQVSPWSTWLESSANLARTTSCSNGITPAQRRARWTCRCCPSSCRSGTSARSVEIC
jgi:hypothetical protein